MLSYFLYITAASLIRISPKSFSNLVATSIAFLFYLCRRGIRRNVKGNLELLGVNRISTFRVFRSFSRVIADFLRLSGGREVNLQEICRIRGREKLDDALQMGRGAILFAPHLGPWEVAGACLASFGYHIHTVALEHPSPRVTRFFTLRRAAWKIRDYLPGECTGKLLRALREGEVVVLLIDRNFSMGGIKLKFFGRDTALPGGHIVLARRTGAPLLPCCCYYDDSGGIGGVIGEALEFSGGTESDEEIGNACLSEVEKYIIAHPEQWFAFDHLWPEARNE